MAKDIFAVRCFHNGTRKLTHKLKRFEAFCLRRAARYLTRYLTKAYKLKGRAPK